MLLLIFHDRSDSDRITGAQIRQVTELSANFVKILLILQLIELLLGFLLLLYP